MKNVLLKIEYDGSSFHGWQEQPGIVTVQGTLQEALSKVIGKTIKVNGTSRTDTGVHALGQCCSFSEDFGIPIENIKDAVNNVLSHGRTGAGTKPGDIRIVECKEVPLDFHARFDSRGKTYKYILDMGTPEVFQRNYCYYINGSLDLELMLEASNYIKGTHDFACFQSAGGTPRETTVRTIYDITIIREDAGSERLNVRVTGDGFLYNMMRIIVGTLVEVGLRKRSPESVREAIESCDRTMAGHTAPAEGLYLEEIYFDDSFKGFSGI